MGVFKGDTRSLDYSSYVQDPGIQACMRTLYGQLLHRELIFPRHVGVPKNTS